MKKKSLQKAKKVVSLILASTLIFSLTGCKKSNNENTSQPVSVEDLEDVTGTPNEWGWVVPEETIEINVYAGQGEQDSFIADEKGGKKAMDDWLLENMNVKINLVYYSNDMTEKLNLMLANGDYPDVITWMSDDMANKFIEQGRAVDLSPYIEKYGSNMTRRLGNYMNLLKSEDGKIYKLAQYWGENPNVAGLDFGVRYDYWKELGETEIYNTPEEYFSVMQKILQNHPTNENGQTTYAFTSESQGMNFLNAMLGAYGFINGYKENESGELKHWLNTEEGLEIAKFVNKCYTAGLIDPDYMSNQYEQVMTKLNNGQVLGNFGTWWHAWTGGHEYWQTQEGDSYDVSKRIMNVSVAGEGISMEDTSLITSNYIGSYRCIITDKCKNVEGVLRFLDWQNSEIGNFICSWGVPSEENVWNIDENGKWVFDEEILNPDQYPKQTYFHDVRDKFSCNPYCLATNMNWLKTDENTNFDMIDARATRVSAYDFWPVDENGDFASEGIRLSWQYYNAPAKDITLKIVSYNSEDDITITKQTIEDTIKTEWNKMITADSAEACEKVFYAAQETCNTIGLNDLTTYVQDAFAKNESIFNGTN